MVSPTRQRTWRGQHGEQCCWLILCVHAPVCCTHWVFLTCINPLFPFLIEGGGVNAQVKMWKMSWLQRRYVYTRLTPCYVWHQGRVQVYTHCSRARLERWIIVALISLHSSTDNIYNHPRVAFVSVKMTYFTAPACCCFHTTLGMRLSSAFTIFKVGL